MLVGLLDTSKAALRVDVRVEWKGFPKVASMAGLLV
jgi:hypothetical protein